MRTITTAEELAALPVGSVILAHWPDDRQPDHHVVRVSEGGAGVRGWTLAGTRHWIGTLDWEAELTVVFVPGDANTTTPGVGISTETPSEVVEQAALVLSSMRGSEVIWDEDRRRAQRLAASGLLRGAVGDGVAPAALATENAPGAG